MTYKGRTIIRHKRGNWFVRVQYRNKIINIYGRTQVEAYNKLKIIADRIEIERAQAVIESLTNQQIAQPIQTKTESEKPSYTLREWFDEWLTSYKAGNVRAVTLASFKKDFRYLNKLHGTKITDLTNLMLSKAINEVSANRQKDKVHNLLKQMFAVAFNNRLVETNPAATLPRPKQFAKNEKRAFTQEQERKFVDLCMQDLDQYEPLLICVLQGLRKGEMLALRPNDFDFENSLLRIDESFDEQHPEDLQTKNDTSNRKMPMFDTIKQILAKYKNADPTERIYQVSGITLFYRLRKLLKKNDLPLLSIHELRHTFISRCHEKGIDEIVIQKWVGHAIGSRMTKAVYTHIPNEAELNYIELMNGKNK